MIIAVTILVANLLRRKVSFIRRAMIPTAVLGGFLSMYGMMTGTISSGVLLLRELDPQLETPAANNLVIGLIVYYFVLLAIVGKRSKKAGKS